MEQQFNFFWFNDPNHFIAGNNFDPVKEESGDANFQLPPPPLPNPHRGGNMSVHRGKLTHRGVSQRVSKFSHQTGIRKHHYSPYTITGKTLSRTLATLAEPEGEHRCQQCPAIYNKAASLVSHVRRAHNENLQVKCPECPKMLSAHNAIKKHLLSHRPGNLFCLVLCWIIIGGLRGEVNFKTFLSANCLQSTVRQLYTV